MKNWKYAVSSAEEASDSAPILLKGSISDNLKKAKKLGYQAIEVHIREDEEIDYEEVKSTMEETGVKIAMIVTGRLNTEGHCSLIDDMPYIVEAAMEGMLRYIDMASEVGADIVIGWAKGNIPPGSSKERYHRRLARNLKVLADYAKERKVKINLEVINRYEVNIFTNAQETVEFLEKYKLDNCYVHLDTFHMNIDEADPIEAIHIAKNWLGYFHLADNNRHYPGSGQIKFKKVLKALTDVGYKGYLAVECLPYPDGETAARKSLEYLKGIEKG